MKISTKTLLLRWFTSDFYQRLIKFLSRNQSAINRRSLMQTIVYPKSKFSIQKLAQVFIILTLVSHFIEIFKLSPLALIGMLQKTISKLMKIIVGKEYAKFVQWTYQFQKLSTEWINFWRHSVAGLLIACFGTLAVFQQMRTAIRVFIVLEVSNLFLHRSRVKQEISRNS